MNPRRLKFLAACTSADLSSRHTDLMGDARTVYRLFVCLLACGCFHACINKLSRAFCRECIAAVLGSPCMLCPCGRQGHDHLSESRVDIMLSCGPFACMCGHRTPILLLGSILKRQTGSQSHIQFRCLLAPCIHVSFASIRMLVFSTAWRGRQSGKL